MKLSFFTQCALVTSVAFSSTSSAKTGEEIYQIYCMACHAPEGQGVRDAAPALANSAWVGGDPARMAQILLHGIQGPITVQGKDFNLAMPPQAALNDEQIAKVMNYVRSSWGHVGSEVDEDFINKERASSAKQEGMYNSSKLKKLYPLNEEPQKIDHLICEQYPYHSDTLSLEGQTPVSVEEEADGLISPSQAGKTKDGYTLEWSGKLKAPEAGNYSFTYLTDDVASLSINGELLINRNGMTAKQLNSASIGKVSLPEGDFTITIRYSHKMDKKVKNKLTLYWSGPSFGSKPLYIQSKKKSVPRVILTPSPERALVHRNFVYDAGSRGLVVGFPEKLNFAFSTSDLNLVYLWQGDFIDAGKAW
ncbi:PA14 domain-containing protein, partial [Akkermansiaceae bacterium]|nr:PA14 domain-containing protein [Akkermansiaceae bacterium]